MKGGARARSVTLLTIFALVAAVSAAGVPVHEPVDRTVALTPPMGWNTWNTFGCNINEKLIEQTADAMVKSGLRDAGYRYVIVDDCWFNPQRDKNGNLQASASFPSGMKALGDYLHARGLKFGLYESPGTKTCAQYSGAYPGETGSHGHETQDARQFAAWGVDYLKYDWCSPDGSISDQLATFATMNDALAATGRPIVYSINPNSIHPTTGGQASWGTVANSWRTTQDITDSWETTAIDGAMGIRNIVDANVSLSKMASPGGFNDPDMLEVGRDGLTETETRSHFALWAMMTAPLVAGNDLRAMTSTTRRILSNKALIAIDQDSLGLQATELPGDGTHRVLVKKLSTGGVAVALFNDSDAASTISTTVQKAGLSGDDVELTDAWTGTISHTSGTISAKVPAHGTTVFIAST